MVRHRRLRLWPGFFLILVVGAMAAIACTGPRAVVTTTPEPTPVPTSTPSMAVEATLQGGGLTPVSRSHPTPAALDAFEKCQVGSFYSIDLVAGMAQIPSARDVYHYVPLTGREPQLRTDDPAWVIRFDGELSMRDETWIDPACIVTARDFGFYGVGPIRNQAGGIVSPEPPASPPDRALPTLAP